MGEKILGIDPSLRATGLGIIEREGDKLTFVTCKTIDLDDSLTVSDCLIRIGAEIGAVIFEHRPDFAVIEAPPYCRNADVMKKLSAVWGISVSAAKLRNVPIYEFPPASIKLAATGSGKASKREMQKGVQSILGLKFRPEADAADALAAAITLAERQHGQSTEIVEKV